MRFIQAGIFGDAANADRLIERLRANGLPAQAIPMGTGERSFTRVLVGPFDTAAGRDAALQTVRTIGPADAMPVGG
jgi:cell division septation protein DedD